MNWITRRALVLAACVSLLAACDRSIDERLAEKNAAESSLGMKPVAFAEKFNATLPKVLSGYPDADAVRLAPLYAIPTDRWPGNGSHVLNVEVGPTHTALLGSMAKSGELRSVGVLLTDNSDAARADFNLCAEAVGGVFGKMSLAPTVARLSRMALEIPDRRSTEVIDDKLLSMQLTKQGLLFQIEQKQ